MSEKLAAKVTDGLIPLTREVQVVTSPTLTALALFKTSIANLKIKVDTLGKPWLLPVALYDIAGGSFFGSTSPFPVIASPAANAKYDSTSGTAAGSTATTATFLQVNEIMITGLALVTAGATTIIVKGTTSGRILATVTLPTIAAATYIPAMVFFPSIALTGETVTLVLSANFTSGTVSVNVYGN